MTRSVSAASTALFRIGFGVVGLLLTARFFAHGWIHTLFIEPQFHFKYPGFEWVEPLPGIGMYLVFVALGSSSVSILLGFRHRIGAAVFAVALAYVELIDRTNYLNHYYWLILTAALMVFLPMGRMWAVDWRRVGSNEVGCVPLWVVWLLRFQVGMVYFFAGVAKLNPDWLFRAEPLATWLPARAELWLIGPLLAAPATAYVLSWLGAIFDLTVVAWLSFKPTRLPAYVSLVAFHLITWLLFPSIGVFPLAMSLGALIFFEPDWPERLLSRHRTVPVSASRLRPVWIAFAGFYVLAMIVIPLRHHFLPGDVRWNGDGYHGSWQVMLTDKTGTVEFEVTRGTETWIEPAPTYLNDRQRAVMATDPALIRQVAMAIADETGGSVSARGRIVVNGTPATTFAIDEANLARSPLLAANWPAPPP